MKNNIITIQSAKDIYAAGFKSVFSLALSSLEPIAAFTLILSSLVEYGKSLDISSNLSNIGFKLFTQSYFISVGLTLQKYIDLTTVSEMRRSLERMVDECKDIFECELDDFIISYYFNTTIYAKLECFTIDLLKKHIQKYPLLL